MEKFEQGTVTLSCGEHFPERPRSNQMSSEGNLGPVRDAGRHCSRDRGKRYVLRNLEQREILSLARLDERLGNSDVWGSYAETDTDCTGRADVAQPLFFVRRPAPEAICQDELTGQQVSAGTRKIRDVHAADCSVDTAIAREQADIELGIRDDLPKQRLLHCYLVQ
jgi:hypothetical protein